MYCDKFSKKMSVYQMDLVHRLALYLQMENTASEVSLKLNFLKSKLRSRVLRDLQLKQFEAV